MPRIPSSNQRPVSTKAQSVADELRREIVSQRLGPGDRLPTRVELEQRFAASTITVQRALDRLAREGFVRARRHSGTFVVDHPPHLYRVGLVFSHRPGTERPWSRFHAALHNAAGQAERWAPMRFAPFYAQEGHLDSEDFLELIHNVRSRRLAGLIWAFEPVELEGGELDPVSHGIGQVFISVNNRFAPRIELRAHDFNVRALHYLRQRGRRRIAVIYSSEVSPDGQAVRDMNAEIRKVGMQSDPAWNLGVDKHRPAWTANLMRLLLDRPSEQRPDALLIHDDNVVEHATAGVVAAGVRVPDDLDVVAHCNFPWPTPSAIPLVRLGFDVRQVLTACVKLLAAQREGIKSGMEMVGPVFEHELS